MLAAALRAASVERTCTAAPSARPRRSLSWGHGRAARSQQSLPSRQTPHSHTLSGHRRPSSQRLGLGTGAM